jgi:hypothetical protein
VENAMRFENTTESRLRRRWAGQGLVLLFAAVASAAVAQEATSGAAPRAETIAPAPATGPAACASVRDFILSGCSLTWHGITVYGAYDVGVG